MPPTRQYHSTAGLVSLLLAIGAGQLAVVLYGIDSLLGPGWLDPVRHWSLLAVFVALLVYHAAYGKRAIARAYWNRRPSDLGVTGLQAVIVTVWAVVGGSFATFLLCQRG